MRVASAVIAGPTRAGPNVTCNAKVVVKTAVGSSNIIGAKVVISWTTLDTPPQFAYNTTVAVAATGAATSVSRRMTSGRGCSFSIGRVTAAGYRPLNTPAVTRNKRFLP
jgi:archaellin